MLVLFKTGVQLGNPRWPPRWPPKYKFQAAIFLAVLFVIFILMVSCFSCFNVGNVLQVDLKEKILIYYLFEYFFLSKFHQVKVKIRGWGYFIYTFFYQTDGNVFFSVAVKNMSMPIVIQVILKQ